jgi:hypothetical protein
LPGLVKGSATSRPLVLVPATERGGVRVEEGVVAGGGVALLRAQEKVLELSKTAKEKKCLPATYCVWDGATDPTAPGRIERWYPSTRSAM